MPNETWQSDFTHYRLTARRRPGADVEIMSWLDDCSRYALLGHRPRPGHRPDRARHLPQSRWPARDPRLHADRQRHGLHHPPRRRHAGRPQRLRDRAPPLAHRPEELPPQPPHHLRQGRTLPTDPQEMAARPTRPADHHRPSCRPSSTPSSTSTTTADPTAPCRTEPPRPRSTRPCPRPLPAATADADTHDRVRHDRVDKAGNVTLRVARPPAPHRRRPNPRRNPRHPARPGPRRPRHQRHHRRTPPRPHHRPTTRLPAHRTPTAPPESKQAEPAILQVRLSRCPETSHW